MMHRVKLIPTPNRHKVTSYKPDMTEAQLANFHRPQSATPMDRNLPITKVEVDLEAAYVVVEYSEDNPFLVLHEGMESILACMQCTRKRHLEKYDDDDGDDEDDGYGTDFDQFIENGGGHSQPTQKAARIGQEGETVFAGFSSTGTDVEPGSVPMPVHLAINAGEASWDNQQTISAPAAPPLKASASAQGGVVQADIQTDWYPNEPGPFLGQLKEDGQQAAMVNSLFRAPVFIHKLTTFSNFLLIRDPDGFSMTPIPDILLCGQTEPQSIHVPVPFTNGVMRSQEMVLALGISRLLESTVPSRTSAPTSAPMTMKYIRETVLSPYTLRYRKRLVSKCNELIERIGLCEDPTSNKKDLRQYRLRGNSLRSHFRRKWLMANISPEQVCAEESSLAAEYRLRQVGITSYPSLDQISAWLSQKRKLRQFIEKRAITLCKRAASAASASSSADKPASILIKCLAHEIVQLDQSIATGRFILDQLQRAPWNITSTFFETHVEPDNKGVLAIDSGAKDKFTFVRFKPDQQRHRQEKYDLRAMTKGYALHVLKDYLEVPDSEIQHLLNNAPTKRHVRASLIDKVCKIATISTNVLSSSGVMDAASNPLAKFSRGEVSAAAGTSHCYISKCNTIWKYQQKRLSSSDENDENKEKENAVVLETYDEKVEIVMQHLQQKAKEDTTTYEYKELKKLKKLLAPPPPAAAAAAAAAAVPQQVVRRTVRQVSEDGTETVTFQFLFCEDVLKRVLRRQKQQLAIVSSEKMI